MGSKFFKEGIIMILLTIAIIILLIIALYEYTPNQNAISVVESYTRTSETATTLQEISTSDIATQKNESIIKSYSVSSSDLSTYEKNYSIVGIGHWCPDIKCTNNGLIQRWIL